MGRFKTEVARYTMNGKTLVIVHDDDPSNPRDEYTESKLFSWHNRYSFGSEKEIEESRGFRLSDYSGWADLGAELISEFRPAAILPVYMYDHGSIAMSTTPFGDRWDSGQIGFILIERSAVAQKRITPAVLKKLERRLADEIEVYSDYANGNAYGYLILDSNGEELDSTWGYLGDGAIDAILHDAPGNWTKAKKVA